MILDENFDKHVIVKLVKQIIVREAKKIILLLLLVCIWEIKILFQKYFNRMHLKMFRT